MLIILWLALCFWESEIAFVKPLCEIIIGFESRLVYSTLGVIFRAI